MTINYWLIVALIGTFFLGIYIGIQLVKFFSDEIIEKLGISFESQLQLSKNFYKRSQREIIEEVYKYADIIENINLALQNYKKLLEHNSQQIDILNSNCDKRLELESEIIKLKKIIQRLERKR